MRDRPTGKASKTAGDQIKIRNDLYPCGDEPSQHTVKARSVFTVLFNLTRIQFAEFAIIFLSNRFDRPCRHRKCANILLNESHTVTSKLVVSSKKVNYLEEMSNSPVPVLHSFKVNTNLLQLKSIFFL